MSDRKNRDKGIKTARKKYNRMCDCWYCMDGNKKKRILTERNNNVQLSSLVYTNEATMGWNN